MILDNQSGSRNVGDEDVIRLEEYSSAVSSGEFEKKNKKERKLTFSAIFIYNNILTYQYRHFSFWIDCIPIARILWQEITRQLENSNNEEKNININILIHKYWNFVSLFNLDFK